MIELRKASKRFGDKVILDQCNFRFEKGKKYVISGNSGVGKTTLLNLAAGYVDLDAGEIKITGEGAYQYLLQETVLFSDLSVKENMIIKYCSGEKKENDILIEEIEKALSAFDILDLMMKKVHELSGGEKRRLELAQIFLFTPDILLLDEPTIALDGENKRKLLASMNHNFADKTALIVSHEDKSLFKGYIHVRLEKGEIVYE